MRQGRNTVGFAIISNITLDLRIVVVGGGDVERKKGSGEEDGESAGAGAELEHTAAVGTEEGAVLEQPLGEGEGAGP